jgi:hypothetical protein
MSEHVPLPDPVPATDDGRIAAERHGPAVAFRPTNVPFDRRSHMRGRKPHAWLSEPYRQRRSRRRGAAGNRSCWEMLQICRL